MPERSDFQKGDRVIFSHPDGILLHAGKVIRTGKTHTTVDVRETKNLGNGDTFERQKGPESEYIVEHRLLRKLPDETLEEPRTQSRLSGICKRIASMFAARIPW